MVDFSREDILHVARLARLTVPESEMEGFLRNFNEIVGYIEKLNALDTVGVSTLFFVPGEPTESTPMAEDEPSPSLQAEAAVGNAPERQDVFFKVPRVIEG